MSAQFYPEENQRPSERFDISKKREEPPKKSKKTKEEKKRSHVKYIVIAVILFLIALTVLILALWSKSDDSGEDPYENAENMYSASRYFCRIKYPNGWEIVPGENGFYIDSETGLFFPAHPYTEEKVEYEGEEGDANAPSTTPEPIRTPIEGVQVYGYYREVPDYVWPEATGEKDPTPPPYSIDEATKTAIDFLTSKGAKDFSSGKDFAGKKVTFKTYLYTTAEGGPGELAVCSRSMAYYFLVYDAKADLFSTYEKSFLSMLNNFEFSVFNY